MRSKIKNIFVISMLFIIPFSVNAATFSSNKEESADKLVNEILGSGLTATNAIRKGTVYTFNDGKSDIGLKSGIILDTSGLIENDEEDPDLRSIMNQKYGGHTSSLEFSMVSTGTLLNFNYVFASGEFDQSETYNDVFGLFVSVKDGPYENIAKITRNDGSEHAVNITNLKAGLSGTELTGNPVLGTEYSLFTAKSISIDNSTTNGVSKVFNAQKVVNKGDIVKIKFVIADVTDKSVNSYVMIESESLSFDPPSAKLDYEDETLQGLDPNTTYKIIDGDTTYEITSNKDGIIPLYGKDDNNTDYNFVGKTVQIIKKGYGDIPDSDPQNVVINQRPTTPDIKVLSITENSISVQKIDNYEYSIDGGKTWQSESTFTGLKPNSEYQIIARYSATDDSVHGTTTTSINIKTIEKEDSILDQLPNVNVTIDLDNDSPIITMSKGNLYESISEDQDLKNAINNNDIVDIKFIVKESTIDEETMTKIKDKLNDKDEIAFSIDASIKLYINNNYVKDITKTSKNMTFKINVPSEYIKKGRKFYIIRMHENENGNLEIERLDDTDNNDSTITVVSDKFSDFTIAYSDTEEINETTSNIPQTGDNIIIYILMLGLSISIISAMYLKNKTLV